MLVADDAGLPADALPLGGGDGVAGAVAQGQVGEEVEQVAAAQSAAVDVEQVEEESWYGALADGGAGTTVPRDARDVEVVLDEPGVGTVGGPEDRHATEGGAAAGGVDDGADGAAGFLVGVGDRHDLGVGGERARDGGGCDVGERGGRGHEVAVGPAVAGEAEQHAHVALLAEGAQQLDVELAERLRQEEHDAGERIGQPAFVDDLDGALQQVALVVPVLDQSLTGEAGHACGVAAAPRCSLEPLQRRRAGHAYLAVEVAQRDDGGRVRSDLVERRAVVGEHTANREVDHGRGDGESFLGPERWTGEPFGQPVQREEVDRGDADVASEPAAGHDSGGVGGHEHRDGPERLPPLGRQHRLAQRRVCGAGRDRCDDETHPVDRSGGVWRSLSCHDPFRPRSAARSSTRPSRVRGRVRHARRGAATESVVGLLRYPVEVIV